MEVTLTKDVKKANSEHLNNLLVWAQYYEDNPRLDYMKLQRVNGTWFIEVVLK